MYREVAQIEISGPYLSLPHESRPAWFEGVYYGAGELSSVKKIQKLCQAHVGEPLADRTLAVLAEWLPILARLDARKADITTAAAMREEKKVAERKAAEAIPPSKLSMVVSAAVDARKPELAAEYGTFVERQFNHMVDALGPKLEGLHEEKNKHWLRFHENTTRALMTREYQIDQAKLAQRAAQYADNVADAMRGKIMDKAGELDEPVITHMRGMDFRLTGTMGGKKVLIEQNTIVNVSPLGTMFNQFPARIYVDGKFTPEAKFKKPS